MRRFLSLFLSSLTAFASMSVVFSATGAGATATDPVLTGAVSGFSPGGAIPWESDADLARDLDTMAATGAKWVRFDFGWPSIEQSKGSFNWVQTDRLVNGARSRGLQVLALPTYTPTWARPTGTSDKTPPTDVANYANFVTAAVQRYAPLGVKAWEVWNEPNQSNFWAPKPDAAAYAKLLKAGGDAIHAADSGATVLTAGLAPAPDAADGSQISPMTFLTRVYDAGVQSSFDAVAIHPYGFPALPMDPNTSGWNPFYRLPLVHDLMVARGDGGKKVWSTEFGAPTGTSSQAVSEATQAQIAHDG